MALPCLFRQATQTNPFIRPAVALRVEIQTSANTTLARRLLIAANSEGCKIERCTLSSSRVADCSVFNSRGEVLYIVSMIADLVSLDCCVRAGLGCFGKTLHSDGGDKINLRMRDEASKITLHFRLASHFQLFPARELPVLDRHWGKT